MTVLLRRRTNDIFYSMLYNLFLNLKQYSNIEQKQKIYVLNTGKNNNEILNSIN